MSVHAESTSDARPKARKAVHPADVQHATDAGLDLLRVIGRLVLHNVSVPGRPEFVIDHVVAGPSGVYVINTIAPTGSVSIAGNILLCAGTPMMDEVGEVAGAAALLRELLYGAPVAPILCFQRNAEVAGVVGEVAVCSTENILELLSGQPDVLDAAGQRDVMRILSDSLVRAVQREPRVELAVAAKPRHRNKSWSLRRASAASPTDEVAAAPVVELAPVPELVAVPELVVVPEFVAGPVVEPEPVVVPEFVAGPVVEPEFVVEPVVEPEPEVEPEFVAGPVVEPEPEVEPAPEVEPEFVAESESVVEPEPVEESAEASYAPVLELVTEMLERVTGLGVRKVVESEEPVVEALEIAETIETTVAADIAADIEPAPNPRAPARPVARPAARPAARPPARPVQMAAGQTPIVDVFADTGAAETEFESEVQARQHRPVWRNPSPERPEPVEPARSDEPAWSEEPTTTANRPRFALPHLEVRPALTRVGGVLARLAPAEPVESVSALKEASVPVGHPLKVTPATKPRGAAPAALPAWAKAPTPRPHLAPVPSPTEEPARRSSVLVTAIVAALVVSAVIMLSPKVPAAVTWGKGLFVDPPAPPVGTLITIGSSALEPSYDVTASAPVPVASTPAGTTVRNGSHLVGIQFRVHNKGTIKLTLPVGARLQALDALGIGYSPSSTVGKTNFGPTLPKVLVIGPGAVLNGSVVFSVPKGRDIEQIRLRLPETKDGEGRSVAWTVD